VANGKFNCADLPRLADYCHRHLASKQKWKTQPCLSSCSCCRNSPAIVRPLFFCARMLLLLLLLLLDYATLGAVVETVVFSLLWFGRSVAGRDCVWRMHWVRFFSFSLPPFLHLALFFCIWIVLIKPPPHPPFAPSDARGSVPLFARETFLLGSLFASVVT
jgi:hypothetical protein